MSLSRLSAGAGYRYLTRYTAAGDARPGPGQGLVEYYAATGLPPGRWAGAGLPGLGTGDGTDLTAGTAVTEEAMGRLFGSGHDPVTGERLGLAYPRFKTAAQRTAERVTRIAADFTRPERAAAVAEIEAQEIARPTRSAVAGYDLTFTVPKSVSVLWAVGDTDLARAVEQAHHDAVAAVLRLVEDRFLHTRIGEGSKIRVPARGAVAAAFEHWDTRAGDPNLHTHLVIANKVQGPDGKWRAVDGQVLFQAAVACSEFYDTTLADLLHARLGVTFGYRDRGPRRTPAFEIEGIADAVLAAFSSRSQAIGAHTQALVAAYTDAHGREPDRVEVLRLRQQATLATRPDKELTPLPELRARWRATAERVTGTGVDAMLDSATETAIETAVDSAIDSAPISGLTSAHNRRASIRTIGAADHLGVELPEVLVARFAEQTVAGVATRRATWTATNLLAEAARVSRALRVPDPQARIAVLDRIVAAALDRCLALDPPAATAAQRFVHPGVDASAKAPEPIYSTWEVLAAEAQLLGAHEDTTAPTAHPRAMEAAAARPMPGAPRLSPDQARAVTAIAGSGRRVDVLVGPAGAGKTRTLFALRAAWELSHGPGSVIGLAPSATAAAHLALALRIPAETVAKWIHESGPASAGGAPWQFRAGQLVLVDEATMAATDHLDRVVSQAAAAGAKVVFVGDHCQLGAVDAGGAFALLAGEGHAVELDQLHRFTEDWEATATRQLRIGDPGCLEVYAAHGRLRDGPAEAMAEAAYRAWAGDLAAGRHSLLLAGDHATVGALNQRARVDRIHAGHVKPDAEAALHDGTAAARGDLVLTRRNQRRLQRPDGGHVRNGDRWQINAVHPDGALDVTPARSDAASCTEVVRLPANYVRDHVELGYALTVHRAQGATADTTHLVADTRMSREALYVGLTRGRTANHAYVATDTPAVETHAPGEDPTGRQILEVILRASAEQTSATSASRQRQAEQVLALSRAGQWPPPEAAPARPLHTRPSDRPPPAAGIAR